FEVDGVAHAVNSSGVLFVAGGAFEELYESVLRRATIGQDVTPMRPVVVVSASGEVREELPFHLRDYLKYEDLFRYGMTPQFVSRFESIVVLNDLSEGDLAKIFVEPDASIFRTSRAYFQRFGIDLQITRGALIAIAWDAAHQKRLGAHVGAELTTSIVDRLEKRVRDEDIRSMDRLTTVLREETRALIPTRIASTIEIGRAKPFVILVVGVNGTGKTTTIAKLAQRFTAEGKSVILGAADTFRAAAIEQLQHWADRVGVSLVKHKAGSDPGAVAHDTVAAAKA